LHPQAEKQAITAPKTVPKRLIFLRQGLFIQQKTLIRSHLLPKPYTSPAKPNLTI
jgi:hypothetical protein